ncbi:MAG: LPP20 family lipoprotein [Candidatus Cloacimonetes bacterium]|nr:LPP20 family lipoprotein [Candidatus Cloacimonadota bacterium]
MKKSLFILIMVIYSHLNADTFQNIIQNNAYLYGTGTAQTSEKANNLALNDLIGKISVTVQTSYSSTVTENGKSIKEVSELIVKTYSSSSLTNVEKIELEMANGQFQVMRYIKKEDLKEIFENRKILLMSLVDDALKSENEMRIGDAMKYYYWSLMLLKTVPEANKIQKEIPNEGNKILLTWLPDRMNRMISKIRLDLKQIDTKADSKIATIEFNAFYDNSEIDNLDYKYRTGSYWSQNIRLNDGFAYLEADKDAINELSQIPLVFEYKYSEQSKCIDAVYQVLSNLEPIHFNTQKILSLKEEKKTALPSDNTLTQTKAPAPVSAGNPEKKTNEHQLDETKAGQYMNVLERVCQAISQKNYQSVKDYFSENGFQQFKKTIEFGNARLFKNPLSNVTFNQSDSRIVARSVPMSFKFKNASTQIIEKVYFTFSADQLIDEVGFTLSNRAAGDIMTKSDQWGSFEAKMALLEFMERYKTAYCLKDIDYINNIFSDNALIIIGRVLKENPDPEKRFDFGQKIQYNRYSKQDFITNLRRAFNSNEFIHIQFDETNVKRAEKDPVYGIQLKQHYNSSSYHDKGYLFLMIDLKNEKEPKIYVRSWQPEKNPDGSILGLDDFRF